LADRYYRPQANSRVVLITDRHRQHRRDGQAHDRLITKWYDERKIGLSGSASARTSTTTCSTK
jgi:hypothetical protein